MAETPHKEQQHPTDIRTKAWARLLSYGIFGGAVIIGMSIFVSYVSMPSWTRHYQKTTGTVLVSRLSIKDGRERPILRAQYHIKKKSYMVGMIPKHGIEGYNNISPKQLIKRLPKGSTVAVYYNPHAPQKATLQRHPPWGWALGIFLFALAWFGWFVRGDQQRQQLLHQAEKTTTLFSSQERTQQQEEALRHEKSAIRWVLLGILLWPAALVAWQKREHALKIYRRLQVEPSTRCRLVGSLALLSIMYPSFLPLFIMLSRI